MAILFAFNQPESLRSSVFIVSNKYLILLLEKNNLMSSGNITYRFYDYKGFLQVVYEEYK